MLLTVEVPAAWSDRRVDTWMVDGIAVGPVLIASPDAAAFLRDEAVPGMLFSASRTLVEEFDQPADYLDALQSVMGGCSYAGRTDYDDGMYTGAIDVWADCRDTGGLIVAIAVEPPDESMLIQVAVQLISEADVDALFTIMESFTARCGWRQRATAESSHTPGATEESPPARLSRGSETRPTPVQVGKGRGSCGHRPFMRRASRRCLEGSAGRVPRVAGGLGRDLATGCSERM